MTRRILNALRNATKTFGTSTWTQPRNAPFHRQAIAQAVQEAQLEYPHAFEYPEINLSGYLRALDEITVMARSDLSGELLQATEQHLHQSRLRAITLASGNDDAYRQAAVSIDKLPDPDLIAEAASLLAEETHPLDAPPAHVSAEALATRFRTALANYALQEWTVETTPEMAARASVNGPLKRLRIRADAQFTCKEADRLLVHEVGGHVLRWENAMQQEEPLASLTLGSAVATEEGLALWGESTTGYLNPAMLRTYAARAVAVDQAQEHGVVEIAAGLQRHLGLEAAVDTALRAKRGLRNPNHNGGLTKDWGYLGGLKSIEKLSRTHAQELQLLHGVKWSMEYLPMAISLHEKGRLANPPLHLDPERLGIPTPSADAE